MSRLMSFTGNQNNSRMYQLYLISYTKKKRNLSQDTSSAAAQNIWPSVSAGIDAMADT